MKFTTDLDQLWAQTDTQSRGYLDQPQALSFLTTLSTSLEHPYNNRARNFSAENFASLYDQFDSDKNGFLEKAEIAALIKKAFRKTPA